MQNLSSFLLSLPQIGQKNALILPEYQKVEIHGCHEATAEREGEMLIHNFEEPPHVSYSFGIPVFRISVSDSAKCSGK